MPLIANARMYAVTPEVRAAWQTLFAWLAEASGVELAYLEHAAPAPIEELWMRDDLGAVFMCGYPFASAAPKPHLIAAPVPSSPRYGGLPRYCTDFVVRADSRFSSLSDTFGGRIGWTVEHSQSGYNAVRYHLLREGRQPRFSQWVGPLVTPRRVVEAVLDGDIEVGPLDSYVHDLLQHHDPGTAVELRTVASTEMTPIPPLVASPSVAEDVVERLRHAVLSSSTDPEMAATFDTLMLTHFVPGNPADYGHLPWQATAADRAGVAKPT